MSLIRNTLWYTLGNLLPRASNFLLLPLYSSFMSPADYGIVSAMNMIQMVLLIIFPLAIDRGIERLYYDFRNEPEKRREFLGTTWLSILGSTLFFLSAALLFRRQLGNIFPAIPFFPYYWYMLIITGTTSLSLLPRIYLRVNGKAKFFMMLSSAEFLVLVSLKIYLLVFRKMGAEGFLLANVISNLIFLPFFLIFSLSVVRLKFRQQYLRNCLVFCLPMIPTLLAAWALNLSNRIFIDRYLSIAEVGLYAFADTLASAVTFLCSGFYLAYGPMFYDLASRENQAQSKRQLFTYNKIFMIAVLLMVFGIDLFIRDFTELLNHRYASCYKLVPIMSLGVLFCQLTGFYNLAIYQSKKTKAIMLLVIGSAIVNITFNFLLIPSFGTSGAAWSAVLTYLLLFAVTYSYAHRCYFIPLAWKELSVYALAFGVAVLFFLFVPMNFYLGLLLKCLVSFGAVLAIVHFNRLAVGTILPSYLRKISWIDSYFTRRAGT